jgi:LPXTG-site transpeptidase (sortase) family protein
MSKKINLRKINNILTIIVVGLGLYITILPFWPNVQLFLTSFFDKSDGFRYESQLATDAMIDDEVLAEAPEGKRLVIPSIRLDEEILVGDNPRLMHQGVWNRPNTTMPPGGGNSVFVGHRFSYDDPAVFYHLDKIEVGERFAVWWDKVEFDYEVFEVLVVKPTQISIEGSSDIPILTLYTCTPIWTATERLVVRAKLLNPEVLENTGVAI